jgi:hypothetical protein
MEAINYAYNYEEEVLMYQIEIYHPQTALRNVSRRSSFKK